MFVMPTQLIYATKDLGNIYMWEWILKMLVQRAMCVVLDWAEFFEVGSLPRFWIRCAGLSSWEYFQQFTRLIMI